MTAARARLLARTASALLAGEVAGRTRRGAEADATTPQRRRAVALRQAFESLGPLYIKVGQILSTRPDFVSPTTMAELETLHDRASVTPFEVMEPVLREELGASWRSRFSFLETARPLGSASLAQVYEGVLRNGRPVVVKVQRPGVTVVMDADMQVLRRVARMIARHAPRFNATVDLETMLAVVFDAMRPELDFRLEAQNMDTARHTIHSFSTLDVPEVVHATRRTLIQTLAPGSNIRSADRSSFKEEDRIAIGRDLLGFMYRGYFEQRFFHADPHPGNILVRPGDKASIIDWGMVGRIDRRMSMSLVLILLGLAQNDGTAAARAWIEMSNPTSWADLAGFSSDIAILVPKIAAASLDDLNFGTTLTDVLKYSTKRGIQSSPLVSILGKSFANIDGSVRYLAPELSVTDVFVDHLRPILTHFVSEATSQSQLAQSLIEQLLLVSSSPSETRGVLRDMANRDTSINWSPTLTGMRAGIFREDRTWRVMAAVAVYLAWRARHRP
ncbi:ABC1 kinase family protein [Streptomyces broussonetiae]|uniref:AarF/UbiB family protein n=1 Tax=Streptomyces broussonetiae TaxID=2686304 RepID=A0ABV5EMD9_9ACTN